MEEHVFARVGRLTASAGVAAAPREGVEAIELLDRADRALTLAKKRGRRRAVSTPQAHAH